MTPYDKMLTIREKMLEDYKKGLIPNNFKPFFDWKLGLCSMEDISKIEAYSMIDEASDLLDEYYDKHPHPFQNIRIYTDDNPWQNYEGFKEDKYIVSYLEAIESELSNLASGGFLS